VLPTQPRPEIGLLVRLEKRPQGSEAFQIASQRWKRHDIHIDKQTSRAVEQIIRHTHVCMYVCMYVRMYAFLYVCLFVCIYIHAYVFTYMHM